MAKFTDNLGRVTRVGLDLAKNVFQAHYVDAKGEVVTTRKLQCRFRVRDYGNRRRAHQRIERRAVLLQTANVHASAQLDRIRPGTTSR